MSKHTKKCECRICIQIYSKEELEHINEPFNEKDLIYIWETQNNYYLSLELCKN